MRTHSQPSPTPADSPRAPQTEREAASNLVTALVERLALGVRRLSTRPTLAYLAEAVHRGVRAGVERFDPGAVERHSPSSSAVSLVTTGLESGAAERELMSLARAIRWSVASLQGLAERASERDPLTALDLCRLARTLESRLELLQEVCDSGPISTKRLMMPLQGAA